MSYRPLSSAKSIWLFGLSGAGKTTFANELVSSINGPYLHLDGDVLRQGVCSDLGFSLHDRIANVTRVAHICKTCNQQGISCIVSMITPTANMRTLARDIIGKDKFRLIYMSTPLEVCIERDSKGLYSKKTMDLTGINQQFDPPMPDEDTSLVLNTATSSLSDMVTLARGFIRKEGL